MACEVTRPLSSGFLFIVISKDNCLQHPCEYSGRIMNVIGKIHQTSGIFERVQQSMRRYLDACILNEGHHFEQLL